MAFTINAICFMHTSMILLFKTSIDCLSKYIQLPNYAKILRKNTICPINCLTQHNTTYTRWNSLLTFHNQRSLKRPSISAVWMHQYAALSFFAFKAKQQICKSDHFCYQIALHNPDNLGLEVWRNLAKFLLQFYLILTDKATFMWFSLFINDLGIKLKTV